MNYNKVCLLICLFQKNINFYFWIKELEILNRKVTDQIRIEQTYDTSQEERMIPWYLSLFLNSLFLFNSVQDDLIKLRAAIETNTGMILFFSPILLFLFFTSVKRSILDRNLSERTTMSQSYDLEFE